MLIIGNGKSNIETEDSTSEAADSTFKTIAILNPYSKLKL
jgi:hypothetical protein